MKKIKIGWGKYKILCNSYGALHPLELRDLRVGEVVNINILRLKGLDIEFARVKGNQVMAAKDLKPISEKIIYIEQVEQLPRNCFVRTTNI